MHLNRKTDFIQEEPEIEKTRSIIVILLRKGQLLT